MTINALRRIFITLYFVNKFAQLVRADCHIICIMTLLLPEKKFTETINIDGCPIKKTDERINYRVG